MRRPIPFVVAAGLSLPALVLACADLVGIPDRYFNGDASSGMPDSSAVDVSLADAGTDAMATSDALPSTDASSCPDGMVAAGTFCIDSTEVTESDYVAFMSSYDAAVAGEPAACAFNVGFATQHVTTCLGYSPSLQSARAIACVNWCEAYDYCLAHGKHLCGAIDGGPVPQAEGATNASEWYAACSHSDNGQHTYAYGPVWEAGVCNGYKSGQGAVIVVGSFAGCVGGFPGLYDMSGNVWEWEDSCSPVDGGVEGGAFRCSRRGGGYTDVLQTQETCASDFAVETMGSAADDTGFRCCLR